MSKTVIVGAGISGLILAKRLLALNIDVKGLEKESKSGGGIEHGHHRLYSIEAHTLLSEEFPGLEWNRIEENPLQVRKGEISPEIDELTEPEAFYLGQPFFHPKTTYSELVERLDNSCKGVFQFRSAVTAVDLDRKTLFCLNGTEVSYDYLVWTGSLASLTKAADRTPKGLAKTKKPLETGGISWDIGVAEPLFTQSNTLVFPFRYKDLRLKALGVRAGADTNSKTHTYNWMVFLEDALMENHEELAKIFRAFKRELAKQFPVLEKGVSQERLAYHPSLSGVVPVPATTLEVFENVACTGSDIQTEEVAPEAGRPLRNLDLILRNTLDVLDLTVPKWQKTASTRAEKTEETSPAIEAV